MNKKKLIFIVSVLLLIALFGCYTGYVLFLKNDQTTPVLHSNISKTVVYALADHQRKDGFIDYSFYFNTIKYQKIDNFIHQSEVALLYADYLETFSLDNKIKTALKNLLTSLSNKLATGIYGLQLSFNPAEEDEDIKKRQQRAEIAATAIAYAAMVKYRQIYSELDFATTESYFHETITKVANSLIEGKDFLNPVYKYPPYEVWYALALYNNYESSHKLNSLLTKLDRFFVASDTAANNKNNLSYFLKTYNLRKKSSSLYVMGTVLRNIRDFDKIYSSTYDSSVLGCQNTIILKDSLEILTFLNKDKDLQYLLEKQINISNEANRKFFITPNLLNLLRNISYYNPKIKELPPSIFKKFTGFFLSDYDNPITTIKNSIDCYYAFKQKEF